MQCDKCGAAAADGASVCPECGVPLASAARPARRPLNVAGSGGRRRMALKVALVVLVLAIAGAAAYFFWPDPPLSGPEGAAQRMMQAFAEYDAEAILDNATHASMTTTDVAAFTKQAEDAKKLADGKPGLKDLKIIETTIDPKDPNTAVVKLSAQWLTDQAKGTYTQRDETVTVVLKDGKWLVRLFQ